ncbi:hypothetical protein F0562_014855 [Nyssa sinensis]|uniref:MBD domain-containing protein n=1 Tax=Nyssa sinensis TaxID=561372 RepID=A0A5J4ZRE9_9ASTE|nr:hypothetical protein F0562_014855 [Nyssa sinensis]
MTDDSSNQLPPEWVLDSKRRKDGSEFYRNLVTGQKFDTIEAVLRYVNYAKNIAPLIDSGKLTYKDFMAQDAADKGKSASESSSVTVDKVDGPGSNDKGKQKKISAKSNKGSKKSAGKRA